MIEKIIHHINTSFIKRFVLHYEIKWFCKQMGYCDRTAQVLMPPQVCTCPKKVFLYEYTNLYEGATIIINPLGDGGKFIMKRQSGAAQNLTVITGNHNRKKGHYYKDFSSEHIFDSDKDVIVEEDVWIGADVTLLPGVHIGRGASIGSGAVVRDNVPPYAIVIGNPSKIVGFCFTPEEAIEHEMRLYSEEERLSSELINNNYEKFFLKRIKEIKCFTRI